MLLAAGKGTRLKPLTEQWPKCLMPIGDRPLLEYWLETLRRAGIRTVMVNLHHQADSVRTFLRRLRFADWVESVYETELLGTAGTLLSNSSFFQDCTTLLVHADNWCQCDFVDFLAVVIFMEHDRFQQLMMKHREKPRKNLKVGKLL
mgnify:CR=1 FL=1